MDQMFSGCGRGVAPRLQRMRKGLGGEEIECGPLDQQVES